MLKFTSHRQVHTLPPSRSLLGTLGLVLLRGCEVLLFVLLVLLVLGWGLYRLYGQDLPDVAQLARHRPFETTRIYARDGETLLYELYHEGQRTVVPLAEVPWTLKAATIAVEDAHFYRNPGVDLRGVVRALWLNRDGEVRAGGSTITQQLARNVLLQDERYTRTYERKIREAFLALQLSRRFSKDQILAFYLNENYYGNLAYGVEAAAQSYFGKHVRDLNLPEAALLAGLVQAPSELNPFLAPEAAKERQRVVLELMQRQGYLSRDEANAAYAAPLELRSAAIDIASPHWVFYVRDLLEQQFGPEFVRRGGLQVVTTLDPALQALAEQAVREQLTQLRQYHANNAAVVVIDPRTSEILAMVGSANYNDAAIDGQVNVALAPRQPGSTLKPIVYAAAMLRGWTPSTIIWDTPTNFNGYRPRNHDDTFHGPQRLRSALANSLNVPAVKALDFVGLEAFVSLARAMGVATPIDPQRHGLALALGAAEVTLLDVTTAYTTFANDGRARQPVALSKVMTNQGEVLYSYAPPPGAPVLGPHSAGLAYLVSDILSDNQARSMMFGLNSPLRLSGDRPAAVKTGTSNDYRDSWTVGYTPDLVVGVWVGNSDGAPMQDVAGTGGAALIWRQIMEQAHAGTPVRSFERPADVEEHTICASTGLPADGCADVVSELFLRAVLPTPQADHHVTLGVGDAGDCLATAATPPDERRQRTFLVPPPDAQGWPTPDLPSQPCAPPGMPDRDD